MEKQTISIERVNETNRGVTLEGIRVNLPKGPVNFYVTPFPWQGSTDTWVVAKDGLYHWDPKEGPELLTKECAMEKADQDAENFARKCYPEYELVRG